MSNSSKNDIEAIIKDFLDLWQKQFTFTSRSGANVANMLNSFKNMPEDFIKKQIRENNAQSDTAANIPESADDELCKLKARIASLEKRLSEFESKPAGSSRGNQNTAA